MRTFFRHWDIPLAKSLKANTDITRKTRELLTSLMGHHGSDAVTDIQESKAYCVKANPIELKGQSSGLACFNHITKKNLTWEVFAPKILAKYADALLGRWSCF